MKLLAVIKRPITREFMYYRTLIEKINVVNQQSNIAEPPLKHIPRTQKIRMMTMNNIIDQLFVLVV